MTTKTKLTESSEDYLETILELQTHHMVARSKDIARKLDIRRGSVTGMLKKLAALGFVDYRPYGFVTLTPMGSEIAKEIESRHLLFKDFLVRLLDMDEASADAIACRMEHIMDTPTCEKFRQFVAAVDACPNCGKK